MTLEKNQLHTAPIESYASDGSGVCRIDGRAVFVPGAMAGEKWEIRIVKVKSSAVFGKGEKLLSPSPARVKPTCPVFGPCGGCDLMHMSYAEELEFKLLRVRDAVRRIGGLDTPVSEIIPAPSALGYRNKGIYAVTSLESGIAAGFYRRRSHSVVPVRGCAIQAELSNRVAQATLRFMAENGVPPYDEAAGVGFVRHIFSRCAFGTGEAMAVIVTAREGLRAEALTTALLKECPELTAIQLCVNPGRGNVVLAGELKTLWGRDYIEEILCGLRFRLNARSFFQINPPQAERLYAEAARMADARSGGTALDLYCGAGTISLFLASQGFERVIGVEAVPEAVRDARINAENNGVFNAEFILADAAEGAAHLKKQGVRPRAVIVDPPRKGLTPQTIEAVAEISPGRLVYISCDPATFARDLKLLVAKGFSPVEIKALDMFPRCANVETIALLRRGMG